jgi:hypothetical protein
MTPDKPAEAREREAFEAWFFKDTGVSGESFREERGNDYGGLYSPPGAAWDAWRERARRASLAAEVAQPQSRAVAPQADEAAKRKPACSRCRSPDFCAALGCADIAVHGWNRDEAAQPESAVASASQCDSTIVEAARKGLAAILELRDSSDESLECEMWPRIEDAIAALRQALEAKA